MFKYLTNIDGVRNFEQSGNLSRQNIISEYDIGMRLLKFNAVDTLSIGVLSQNDTSSYKVYGNNVNANHPYWKAFDDDDNTYANIGNLYTEKYLLFQFKKKRENITSVAMSLYTCPPEEREYYIYNIFDIFAYGSDDGITWHFIDMVSSSIPYDDGNINGIYYRESPVERYDYSPINPTIIFNMKNDQKYFFYRWSFVNNSFFNAQTPDINILSMKLYSQPSTKDAIHYFPLSEDSVDVNGFHTGVERTVTRGVIGGKLCTILSGGANSSSITYSSSFANGMRNFSYSFFFWVDENHVSGSIVSKSKEDWNVECIASGDNYIFNIVVLNHANKVVISVPKATIANKWHHMTVVFQNNRQFVWLDAVYQFAISYTGAINNNLNREMNIGCETVEGGRENFFKGAIRELMVYNYALNESQIRQIYSSFI